MEKLPTNGHQEAVQEKTPQLQTENLGKLREIISRYQAITQHPDLVNRDEIDKVFARCGLSLEEIPGAIGYQVNEGKLTNFFGDLFEKRRQELDVEEQGVRRLFGSDALERRKELDPYFQSDEIQTDEKLINAENQFRDLYLINLFLNQTISPRDKAQGSDLLELARKTAAFSQAVYLRWIQRNTIQLFREDALVDTQLPVKYKETISKIHGESQQRGLILDDLKRLAFVTANPDLQKEYNDVLDFLGKDYSSCGRFVDVVLPYFRTKVNGIPLNRAIDNICRFFTFVEKDEWDKIEATPEQVQILYNLVEKSFFEHLFTSASISTRKTRIILFFSMIKDPRAISGLVKFVREPPISHDHATAVEAISKIVEEPLSAGDLEKTLAGLIPLERRIINEWFLNPSPAMKTVIRECIPNTLAACIESPESHLIYGELVNLAFKIASASQEQIDPGALAAYFLGNFGEWSGTDQVDRLLLKNLHQTALIMAGSKIVDWRTTNPIIFNALVSPQDKDYFFFPGAIAREGLALNPQFTDKLASLYQSKDLQKGFLARAIFAEGLLFLTTKENGGEILESMLSVTRGTREDPSRIREIFQWMRALDSFGVFGFEAKGSLNEITADLKEKVVEAAKEKMEISEQEMPFLRERLNFLLQNKAFEIIPALLGQYEKREDNTKNVIREIGRHIILGDFKEWRDGLPTSLAQLAVLPEDKRAAWLAPANELHVPIRMQKQEEARTGALEAIKRIIQESKAHIAEVYRLDFSPDRIRVLKLQHDQLTKDLKDQTKDAEVKKELGMKKRSVDLELQVLEGMTGLESLSPDELQPIKILEIISKTKNALNSLGSLEQAQQDLDQISEVLTTQKELASVEELKAYDSDDPFALLNVGVEPRQTCQSWIEGSHNYCLPAYVADANKRIINVEGNNQEVLARSVMKLTHLQGENGQKIPAILLEPIYTTSELPQIYRAIVRIALAKASATGAVLVVSGEKMIASGVDHSHTIPLLSSEAQKKRFQYEEKDVRIFTPQSFNPHEYSDSLGGDISRFGNYHSLKNAVIITPF